MGECSDIVYFFEHAPRELDVACAVACLLRERGVRTTIAQWPHGFYRVADMPTPAVVVLPFCYTENSFADCLLEWRDAAYFNMSWEQLFYPGNRNAKSPRGPFALNHVIHHAWGASYADWLQDRGVHSDNVFVNGHPAYALYDRPYRGYFDSRSELAEKHGLSRAKRWVFFPENYNWAFYSDQTLRRFIDAGQDPEHVTQMRDFCDRSVRETLQWCAQVAGTEEAEVIVRPRPATPLPEFRRFAEGVLDAVGAGLHFIQQGSVREWILASDVVVSSHSTSLIEAALAGKPAYMLAPEPMPDALVVDWHRHARRISNAEELKAAVRSGGEDLAESTELAKWARSGMMANGDPISGLADYLQELANGNRSAPPPVARRHAAPRGRLGRLGIPRAALFEGRRLLYRQRRRRPSERIEPEYLPDLAGEEEVEERIQKWSTLLLRAPGWIGHPRARAMRVFITGVRGFVGRHLARHLVREGHEVSGLDTRTDPGSDLSGVRVFSGDLLSGSKVAEVLREVRPHRIFHLAAATKASEPATFYRINVLGTVSLLEALKTAGIIPIVVVASSSAVYGNSDGERPIEEQDPGRPLTSYGASKLAQEVVAMQYARADGFHICCTRTFNLLGPDLPPRYACSSFARQIVAAERAEGPEVIETGRLETRRDFTDVRDAVRAYDLVAERGRAGETYNVCAGRAVSIHWCLNQLVSESRVPLSTVVKADRLQDQDVTAQVGSAAKLREHTGWVPEIPLRESLADLLNYWREENRGLDE